MDGVVRERKDAAPLAAVIRVNALFRARGDGALCDAPGDHRVPAAVVTVGIRVNALVYRVRDKGTGHLEIDDGPAFVGVGVYTPTPGIDEHAVPDLDRHGGTAAAINVDALEFRIVDHRVPQDDRVTGRPAIEQQTTLAIPDIGVAEVHDAVAADAQPVPRPGLGTGGQHDAITGRSARDQVSVDDQLGAVVVVAAIRGVDPRGRDDFASRQKGQSHARGYRDIAFELDTARPSFVRYQRPGHRGHRIVDCDTHRRRRCLDRAHLVDDP